MSEVRANRKGRAALLVRKVFLFALATLLCAGQLDPGRADAATGSDLDQLLRSCGLVKGPVARVRSIVDGDTVVLEDGTQVRLVGIQAPKLPLGRKNFEPWPLGDEAKAALTSLVLGHNVRLYLGTTREDRHGRVLAHLVRVTEENEAALWAQAEMLGDGYGRVYSFSDNRLCTAPLYEAEHKARAGGRGIWTHAFYRILSDGQAWDHLDSFQLVEGRVLDVSEVSSGVYLNFGENWRDDFTIFVPRSDLRRFEGGVESLLSVKGQRIRVRGWLKLRNGPMIDLTHPEQLERLGG